MTPNETDKARYEVITQETNDGSGDVIIPLPAPLLKTLGWGEDNRTSHRRQ